LILVSEPYYNEPGYERYYGTPQGNESSREYTANIRRGTLQHAMIDILKNPPAGFELTIREHFRLSKDEILNEVKKWIKEDKNKSDITALMKKLQTEFDKL